jgi:hypothetical protein
MSKKDQTAAAEAKPGTIDTNPLGVLAGGLAVGAAIGALLPRSQRERDLLRPVGAKLGTLAVAAVAAAREAGQAELESRGLTLDQAREQARGLFKDAGQVASKAGTAAVDAARGSQPGSQPANDTKPQAMAGAGADAGEGSGFNAGA